MVIFATFPKKLSNQIDKSKISNTVYFRLLASPNYLNIELFQRQKCLAFANQNTKRGTLQRIIFLYRFLFIVFAAFLLPSATVTAQNSPWEEINEGMHLAEFDSPIKSKTGDSKITILKIDPEIYEFKLLMASEQEGDARSVRQWAEDFQLVAATNAGMYQKDFLASVGYMKSFSHINNPHLNKNNTVFAFNPKDSTAKPAQIIDRTCQDFESIKPDYHSFVQSIRMVSCQQENVWAKQPTRWSIASLGADKSGNILFMFSRSPYAVHDFINIVLTLPISLYNAMYLEGGSKAALYFTKGDTRVEKFGNFETAAERESELGNAWPIPNVLGIVKKDN